MDSLNTVYKACVLSVWLLVRLWRRSVFGSIRPPASKASCSVRLMWTLPWVRPDRLSANLTGTDTKNCEYQNIKSAHETVSATVTPIQATLMLTCGNIVTETDYSAGSHLGVNLFWAERKSVFNRFSWLGNLSGIWSLTYRSKWKTFHK